MCIEACMSLSGERSAAGYWTFGLSRVGIEGMRGEHLQGLAPVCPDGDRGAGDLPGRVQAGKGISSGLADDDGEAVPS